MSDDEPTNILELDDDIPADTAFGEAVSIAVQIFGAYARHASNSARRYAGQELTAFIVERASLIEMSGGPVYVTLVERNGHEGETWRFYIPLAGNDDALTVLSAALDSLNEWNTDDDIEFELEEGWLAEAFVNDRCSISDSGYMDAHNKLAGRLVIPEVPDHLAAADLDQLQIWFQETLYKGGIRKMMVAT